ncbi:hypothetical protein [Nocardioides pakistanensis]
MTVPAPRQPHPAAMLMAVPCWTAALADEFAAYLRNRGVHVQAVHNDTVAIPFNGSVRFAVEVTTAAVFGEYADAGDMADLLADVADPAGSPVVPVHVAV